MARAPRPLRDSGVRFVLALVVLLAAGQLYGDRLVRALLPAFRAEIGWLDANYRVLDLSLAREGSDRVLALEVGLARPVILGGRALLPDPRARARVTTLAGHVLAPVILCCAVAAAWPAAGWREAALRALMTPVFAGAVTFADVPFVLLGEVWAIQVSALEPDRFSPLLIWKDFLQGGGRFALGLVAGVLAIVVAGALARQRVGKQRGGYS